MSRQTPVGIRRDIRRLIVDGRKRGLKGRPRGDVHHEYHPGRMRIMAAVDHRRYHYEGLRDLARLVKANP